ncbi:MAG TPA: 30S ribosomal protein S8 [Syntrophales bacterium]|nr:30S ribosomal protein S8 [Syntrophales bacterium]HOM06781.1 30S ribosomal protein S8 [Syntrophales bacterium]HON99524.1 30S ribosomal protein S8 [Syntrophales bacterium]HPC00741.1 30S ribosomal protein S8 [Syntrophales bacterium]HPQ06061.1 30S ribosomal protein S8 [Syntrophales bacterium]
MAITDPIADMLTRIRNANRARFKSVDVRLSKMNKTIAEVLKKAGYIEGWEIRKDATQHDVLRIYLRYLDLKRTVITDIQRVSRPGRRIYVKSDEIPKVLNGLGISIVSTSRGVMTDAEAREARLGGEIICKVW